MPAQVQNMRGYVRALAGLRAPLDSLKAVIDVMKFDAERNTPRDRWLLAPINKIIRKYHDLGEGRFVTQTEGEQSTVYANSGPGVSRKEQGEWKKFSDEYFRVKLARNYLRLVATSENFPASLELRGIIKQFEHWHDFMRFRVNLASAALKWAPRFHVSEDALYYNSLFRGAVWFTSWGR